MKYSNFLPALLLSISNTYALADSVDIGPAMRLHSFEHYPLNPHSVLPAFSGMQSIIKDQTGLDLVLLGRDTFELSTEQLPIIFVISSTSSQFMFTQKIGDTSVIFVNMSRRDDFQNRFSTTEFPTYKWFGVESEADPNTLLSIGVDTDLEVKELQILLDEGFIYFALAHEVAHVAQGHEGSYGHLDCAVDNLQISETARKEIENEADQLAIRYILDNRHFRAVADNGHLTDDDFIDVALSPERTAEERVLLAATAYLFSGLAGLEPYVSDIGSVITGIDDLEEIDAEVRMAVAQQLLDCSDSYNTYQVRNLRNLVSFASVMLETSAIQSLSERDLLQVEFILSGVERQILAARRRLLESIE